MMLAHTHHLGCDDWYHRAFVAFPNFTLSWTRMFPKPACRCKGPSYPQPMSFPSPTHAIPIVKCVDGKVLVPFPNASHPIPKCLPVPFPTMFPYPSWYPSQTVPSEAKPHILPIRGAHPGPIEAPKPSHPVLDGKCLGLVWEECFVIASAF